MNNLEKYFGKNIWKYIEKYLENIIEIRIRIHCPLIILLNDKELVISEYIPSESDVEMIFNRLTNFSAYAYENEIKNGYLTIPGGHRVGLMGEAVIKNGKYCGMKNIRYLNFRICHTIENFGIEIVHKIMDGQTIKNTLIISKPGYGKTTLLRNLVKFLSNNQSGTSITVIDERNEISGCYLGIPQIDLGIRSDVVCGIDKNTGTLMAIRTMAPRIIAVDEIGEDEDLNAISKAFQCGIKVMATIHGEHIYQVKNRIGEVLLKQFEVILLIEERGHIRVV